jgi:N6-adenosine-specific RNA methylase IME4
MSDGVAAISPVSFWVPDCILVGQVGSEELDHLGAILDRPKPPKGDQLGSIAIALNSARNDRCDNPPGRDHAGGDTVCRDPERPEILRQIPRIVGDSGLRLPVSSWAASDSVLLLWVTRPILPRAFEVIETWGFEYKTVAFTWVKTLPSEYDNDPCLFGPPPLRFAFGMGHWTRSNPEQCLLATRGKPHRVNADVPELLLAHRREHSRKPDEVYDLVERLVAGPYLELFARQRRPGREVAFSREADSGPGERRWASNNYPGAPPAAPAAPKKPRSNRAESRNSPSTSRW